MFRSLIARWVRSGLTTPLERLLLALAYRHLRSHQYLAQVAILNLNNPRLLKIIHINKKKDSGSNHLHSPDIRKNHRHVKQESVSQLTISLSWRPLFSVPFIPKKRNNCTTFTAACKTRKRVEIPFQSNLVVTSSVPPPADIHFTEN